MLTGAGSVVKIRPTNTGCGAGLAKGQEIQIPISRPRPTLSIAGDDYICSGYKTYSISGTLPPGATVCWSSSHTAYATVPASPGNCSTSIPVTYLAPGATTLTATISDCIESYTITKNITIGAAIGGHYIINSDSHNPGIFYPLYNNNSPVWLPANKSFGINAYLTSPGITSYTWSRASTSYPFSWGVAGGYLGIAGSSGSSAFQERDGIFNLTAQTSCGTYTGTFKWPVIVQGWGLRISTSPNPATNNLTVSIEDAAPEAKALSSNETIAITLYRFNNTATVKTWTFKNNQSKFNLNVSDIQKGQYVLKVQKGKYHQSELIMIE